MKVNNLLSLKFFIVYLYGVFTLNVVSIFYMNRANNSLNDKMEFWTTLIIPIIVAVIAVANSSKLTPKQAIWALVGLFVGGPLVFFAHVAMSL